MKLFIDTWGWIVLGNKREPRHAELLEFYSAWKKQKGSSYTTDYVLDETFTLLFRRLRIEDAKESVNAIEKGIESCNVAYRKNAIEEAGWFNEWDAKVYHYRRPTWKRFYKQANKYAVGRMQAIKLHWKMGEWYHYIVLALILPIIVLFALSPFKPASLLAAFSIFVIGGLESG